MSGAVDTNHGDEAKGQWWDAPGVIGISAYYPVSAKPDTSLGRMLASSSKTRDRLMPPSARWQRPVMFVEIGVRSARTATTMPWDWRYGERPVDAEEQTRFCESALKTFYDEPWFCGLSWWDWPARLYPKEKGPENRGFCCFGKPAEEVLRKYYGREPGAASRKEAAPAEFGATFRTPFWCPHPFGAFVDRIARRGIITKPTQGAHLGV